MEKENKDYIPIPLPPQEIQQHQRLITVEQTYLPDSGYPKNPGAATLRRIALNVIEAYYKCDDFDAFIPYLAMTYFDRLTSRHKIQRQHDDETKNNDLFVMCCLTIAWKLRTKSFKLPQFLAKLQRDYEASDVLNMELFILNQLEWRMRSLTPFNFTEYFISILNPPRDQLSSTRKLVRQIIVTSQADMRITILRPSLVAASAVLAVSKKHLPKRSSSRLKDALVTFDHIRKKELSTCKKILKPICKAKVKSLKNSSTKKETKAETSSSGVGGTGQVAGASSSSLQKPASLAGACSSGAGEASQVAGASSSSLQEPESSELPVEENMPEGTDGDKAESKRAMEEIPQDPKARAKWLGKRPVGQIQQDLTPAQEVAPASAGTNDLELDFELGWSKYDELIRRKSVLNRLAACSGPSCTTPNILDLGCCCIL